MYRPTPPNLAIHLYYYANDKMVSYPYRVLDNASQSIRILKLQPGERHEPVRCNVRHISLLDREHQPYEAISYCWSTLPGTATIELDGVVVTTTKSSEAALRRVRLLDQPRWVWIDAICINQNDVQERSQQVTIMGKVYEQTLRTLVWLGPGNAAPSETLGALHHVYEEMRMATDDFRLLEDYEAMSLVINAHKTKRLGIDPSPLIDIFASPWYRRVWIVQEVALPPSSHCYYGDIDLPLREVLMVGCWISWNYLSDIRDDHVEAKAGFSAASDLGELTIDSQHYDLHSLLLLSAHREKTDARDSVYGVLGLTSMAQDGAIPSLLQPDYSKALHTVLRDITRWLVAQDNSVYDGEFALPVDHIEFQECCSWAPLLHVRPDRTRTPNRLPGGPFQAMGGVRLVSSSNTDADENVLVLQGLTYGNVSAVSEMLPYGASEEAIKAFIVDARSLCEREHPTGSTSDLSSVLVAGSLETTRLGRFGRVGDVELREHLNALLDCNGSPDGEQDGGAIPMAARDAEQSTSSTSNKALLASRYRRQCAIVCTNRRFFVLAGGAVGVGPSQMRAIDVVALISGSRLPLVLRPCGYFYRLVGICYLHGVMFGEQQERFGREDQFRSFRLV